MPGEPGQKYPALLIVERTGNKTGPCWSWLSKVFLLQLSTALFFRQGREALPRQREAFHKMAFSYKISLRIISKKVKRSFNA